MRKSDIDRAKGLAIILVVFGHIVARDPPLGNEWYVIWKQAVYTFHMAFFMFLSGVVFFKNLKPVSDISSLCGLMLKRISRLIPAYLVFAGVVFLGKYCAQKYVHVDNPVVDFSGLLDIVAYPMHSVASFLWYIYTLLAFSLVAFFLVCYCGIRIGYLVVAGSVFVFVPSIDFMAIGQFTKYFLFFSLGGLAVTHWGLYAGLVDRCWLLALFALSAYFWICPAEMVSELWLLPALLSLFALHGLCRNLLRLSVLDSLGRMTFPVYLMNTIFIGLIKAVLLKFIVWDGINFLLLYVPVLMVAGLFLPILTKRYIFSRLPWLDRITS